MAASDVRKNFVVSVDGRGYAGQVEECNPPKLTLKTEEFRGGGMNAPIELTVGMEKMDADFSMVKFDKDILGLFSVVEGNSVPFVIREVLESFGGGLTTVIHTMRGKIKEMDPGASKPGDIPKLKISMALSYYKLQHGSTLVHEIDVENMIQVINGVDVLAGMRTALGI